MHLRDAAKGYLGEAAEPWHGLAATLAAAVAEDVSRRMVELDNRLDGARLGEILSSEFTALLLTPANVLLIAGTGSDGSACVEVARCLRSWVNEADVSTAEDWGVEWREYVVDLLEGEGEPSDLLLDRLRVEDAGQGPLRLQILPSVKAHLDVRRIARLVAETSGPMPQAEEVSEALVRLDVVVDVALYQALCAHPELLRTLNWRAFERLLADTLETFGYSVELQRGTKDGGVDIFAIRNDHFGAAKYVLQAKRWTNRVSVEPVRQLLFLQTHYRATKCCLATTSSFTKGALELGNQYRWQLDLRDWDGLQAWVREAARLKVDKGRVR